MSKSKQKKNTPKDASKTPFLERGLNTKFSHTFNTPEFQKPFFRNWLITAAVCALAAGIGTGVYRDYKADKIQAEMQTLTEERTTAMANATEEEIGNLDDYYQLCISYLGALIQSKNSALTDAAAIVYNNVNFEVSYTPKKVAWISGSNNISYDETLVDYCDNMIHNQNASVSIYDYYVKDGQLVPGIVYATAYTTDEDGQVVLAKSDDTDLTPADMDLSDYTYHEDEASLYEAGNPDSECVTYLSKVERKANEVGGYENTLPHNNHYIVAAADCTMNGVYSTVFAAAVYDFWGENQYGLILAYALTLLASLVIATIYTYIRLKHKQEAESENTKEEKGNTGSRK